MHCGTGTFRNLRFDTSTIVFTTKLVCPIKNLVIVGQEVLFTLQSRQLTSRPEPILQLQVNRLGQSEQSTSPTPQLQTDAVLVSVTACYLCNRQFSLKTYQTNPNSSELTSPLRSDTATSWCFIQISFFKTYPSSFSQGED